MEEKKKQVKKSTKRRSKTGFVWLLTGPPGAGKTTIAKELASRLEKAVWIDVDSLRAMVVSGNVKPYDKTTEAGLQVAISLENACDIAKNFAEKGFNVFIDDVVVSTKRLEQCRQKLKAFEFKAFLLTADEKTIKKRDRQRRPEQVMGRRANELHAAFSKTGSKDWIKIDTNRKTINETADEILKATKQQQQKKCFNTPKPT